MAQPSLVNLLITNNVDLFFGGAGLLAEAGSPLSLVNIQFVDNDGRGAMVNADVSILDSHFEGNRGDGGEA